MLITPMHVRQATLHSVHGKQQLGAFSLGAEVAREGTALVCSYPDGLAVLTAATAAIWAVEGLEQPRPQKLAGLPKQYAGAVPSALAAVDPAHTLSGCLEVGCPVCDTCKGPRSYLEPLQCPLAALNRLGLSKHCKGIMAPEYPEPLCSDCPELLFRLTADLRPE